jgi:hypothetical protein
LTVYAPAFNQAVEGTDRFLKEYLQQKPAPTPRFYLLNARPTGFDIESINLSQPSVMSSQELELHYGENAVRFEQVLVDSLCRK